MVGGRGHFCTHHCKLSQLGGGKGMVGGRGHFCTHHCKLSRLGGGEDTSVHIVVNSAYYVTVINLA